MFSKGKFIVIEGLDGSGKTTQTKIITDKLIAKGINVVNHAEPTGREYGKMCREVLSGKKKCTKSQLALLFTADRIDHNVNDEDGINMHVEKGNTVICDRYYYSSLAYQGSETDFDWVLDMNINCPEIRKPDLCIFLDLEPEKCFDRISKNRLVKEIYEETERLERYRKRYFEIFDMLKFTDNIAIIDTAKDIDSVAAEVYAKVSELDV